jgi:sialic acid synthase SpsE
LLTNDVTNPYVLVDLTLYQDQDLQTLFDTIEDLQSIGADGVNLSIFRTNHLISMVHCPDEADHYREFELDKPDFRELFNQYQTQDFDLIPTVYDLDRLEWYANLNPHGYAGVDAGDITFKRLLTTISSLELSPILSIKASTRKTVEQALKWLTPSPEKILLADLFSADPEQLETELGRLLSVEGDALGFADQFGQRELAECGRDNGAALWKPLYAPDRSKGYTIDGLEPLIEDLKGMDGHLPSPVDGEWELTEKDRDFQQKYRRSLMADRGLPAGGKLDSSMVRELRPGRGLPADKIDELNGMLIQRPAEAQQMISY